MAKPFVAKTLMLMAVYVNSIFFLQKRRPLQSQDHCAKVISMIITIPSFSIVIQKFCSHFYIAWDDKEKQQIYVCKYSVFSQTLLTPICILSAACVAFTDCICRAVGHAQLRYLSCRGARAVACAQPQHAACQCDLENCPLATIDHFSIFNTP